ncbi:hypothetical protein BD310DRAFT_866887 [Dichomitus squalens]|uniref:MYND-type domain-containing protein n=1 Tax=Dichomitus squalens TaxID=114155 RepID=A0A4Q9QBS7_9APHY|nr:hypothetical protein BD310DRAFT_866887 [Dichomitus squalens]
MAHPFFWPGKYFFYPIGNTSAVCLTRDLPPEEHADILILGCGDPRHILYTIFSEPAKAAPRQLDFTCVDFEPGVLARNALLLSLIADEVPVTTIWNIFYHMYLDPASHLALISQCKKLVDLSENMDAWRASPYGQYLRFSTEFTLVEMRRHWSLYIAMPQLPSRRQKAIRDAFTQVFKGRGNSKTTPMTSARSAGPLIFRAWDSGGTQALNYWKTGTTFFQAKDIAGAKLLNPTFAYCLTGEGCGVHYGSDPLTTFHYAALYGNAKVSVSASDMVRVAKEQFSDWCAAFKAVISIPSTAPRVRFFLAEVTAACRALRAFGTTGTLNIGIPVAQFRTQLLHLARQEYVEDHAPTSFNVIETSNLIDHIGLLNVLIAALPLLHSTLWSVLYTESLLFHGLDATKEFADLLYADIGTVGLLLNICPVDYLAGYTTRSNTHELLLHKLISNKDTNQMKQSQFHQVTTWRSPTSCDSIVTLHDARPQSPPQLEPRQLGTLLFDIYHALFEQEDSTTFWRENQQNMLRAVASANMIHYMREGFVLFLKLVRERLRVPHEQWLEVMDRFMDLELTDVTMPMNTVNRNDLQAQLYRQGVYSVTHYRFGSVTRAGRFRDWDVVPPVVRIVLSIPREKITNFESILEETHTGTPLINCDVLGIMTHNIFAAIHVAYGRAIASGSKRSPRVLFEEDPEGRNGTMPLVASWIMPSFLLIDLEPPEQLNVRMCVRSTMATTQLHAKMGLHLDIFSASLMDEEHVHVLPEQPIPQRDIESPPGPAISPNSTLRAQIGRQGRAFVELDEQCELVSALMARIDLEDSDVIREFSAGAMPVVEQVSPCLMRLTIGGRSQDVVFPFPVIGGQNRLRLARKSRYIEVVVPPSGPFLKPDGMKLNPYPVIGSGKALSPWSVHCLALDTLPVLDLAGSQLDGWLNPHVGSMLSTRERSMRKKQKSDALLFVKDSLHSIFVRAAGIQGGRSQRVFALRDEVTNNCDTVLFISDIRYDLHCHTMVCDGYVLPLTPDLLSEIVSFFGELVYGPDMVNVRVFAGEMEAWKQLIPAFVERCRTWEHVDTCEYLKKQEVPLTLEMEKDPLCSCGRGQDVGGLEKVKEWRRLAPYVTRLALSPLFAVSYLESVGRDPTLHKCSVCRGKGKPKLMTCKGCQRVRYCSTACQKKDWPRHKAQCKAK